MLPVEVGWLTFLMKEINKNWKSYFWIGNLEFAHLGILDNGEHVFGGNVWRQFGRPDLLIQKIVKV